MPTSRSRRSPSLAAPGTGWSSPPPGKRVLASITLYAFVVAGCAGGSPMYSRAPMAKEAMGGGMAPPPSAEMAVAPGPEGGPQKIAGEAETWKRSQLAPNTSRLMVGDHEELPLRG